MGERDNVKVGVGAPAPAAGPYEPKAPAWAQFNPSVDELMKWVKEKDPQLGQGMTLVPVPEEDRTVTLCAAKPDDKPGPATLCAAGPNDKPGPAYLCAARKSPAQPKHQARGFEVKDGRLVEKKETSKDPLGGGGPSTRTPGHIGPGKEEGIRGAPQPRLKLDGDEAFGGNRGIDEVNVGGPPNELPSNPFK